MGCENTVIKAHPLHLTFLYADDIPCQQNLHATQVQLGMKYNEAQPCHND